jgi:hypothetical protein
MGKKSRTKGASYENEVCKALFRFFPSAERNLKQYQRSSGRDLDGTARLCFQLKRRKNITLAEIKNGYIEAAESLDEEYDIPILGWRDDGGKSMVMLSLDDLVLIACDIEDGIF